MKNAYRNKELGAVLSEDKNSADKKDENSQLESALSGGKSVGTKLLYLKKGIYKALDMARPYLASLYTLGVVEAKWGEDWGSKPSLHLPSGDTTTVISGTAWYAQNYLLESATLLGVLATAKNKAKTALYLGAYEAVSLVNYYLFDLMKAGSFDLRTYGVVWNDLYYFVQLPIWFLGVLPNYFGQHPFKLLKERLSKKKTKL